MTMLGEAKTLIRSDRRMAMVRAMDENHDQVVALTAIATNILIHFTFKDDLGKELTLDQMVNQPRTVQDRNIVQGFKEIDRGLLIKPTRAQLNRRGGVCWSHPAFAYRHVFARNDEEIVCADLSAR